jgi:hypothetical protein
VPRRTALGLGLQVPKRYRHNLMSSDDLVVKQYVNPPFHHCSEKTPQSLFAVEDRYDPDAVSA